MNPEKSKIPVPLLFDGAFGTYYFALTSDANPCELANLTDREAVLRIHREYLAAGVNAIKTNTFGANPVLVADAAELHRLIAAGWSIAQEAVKDTPVRVFADIGCNDSDNAEQDYLTVAQIFLDLGARDFLFETLAAYEEIVPALALIKKIAPESTVIVSFAVSQDGYTKRGLHYKALLHEAVQNENVDAAGLNCVCGPSHMLKLVGSLDMTSKPLTAMPNSGYPSSLNGRIIFEDNADYFAKKLADLYAAGVDVLGGCCGSTPRHIRLGVQAIAAAKRSPKATLKRTETAKPKSPTDSVLVRHHKIIAVELDPPLDYDCSFILSASAELKECGADMITIADSPLSRTRADSIMTAAKIKREVGIEVLPHLSCRDKNYIALKAGLLGAAFEGINRVLVITGDPPPPSETRKSDGVYNFNSYNLISYINSMNEEVFADSPFLIGGALNVNAVNFSAELRRAQIKLERGAKMLLTQPIFSDAAVENFLLAKKTLDCKLLAGILPVAGYKNAVFLINEVSGIEIPESVVQSLRDKSPEEAAEISTAYSVGIINRIYDAADGFYIMTPLKKVNIVRGLIKEIRRNAQ
ncbi:bifunctional homocysteine S-methyltransferase/methylenetetrahydrofolate reductase [Oscillospiraceae bacterium PP1C4]